MKYWLHQNVLNDDRDINSKCGCSKEKLDDGNFFILDELIKIQTNSKYE